MNITFEEADKIREALKPNASPEARHQAIAILDVAEQKQREKNARTVNYILERRKSDKSYARPKVVTRMKPCDNDCIKCETMRICPNARIEKPKE